ncbi:MAG: 3-phosphoserine/phosphohydroxythreonine transaminase [Ruminococcaceae bacterium]|nr:3-phosphoserine/phosphohydroxythreonine transaminase [Oscillospiraceae bacterium]
MERVFNFSAGPSSLPLEVLEKAAGELTCYKNSGMSVMEMSHRSKDYEEIIFKTNSMFYELMNIPDNYKVLFLQGGASTQFAMVPLNLYGKNMKADYVVTGQFAGKAQAEGSKFGEARIVASSKDKTFSYIPKLTAADFSKDADFAHITLNNTIYGTRYNYIPDTGSVPLVADISSCILSEKLDVSKFGLLYAGAQKNIGPAGLTVVIIREDLIGNPLSITPTMLDYSVHANNDSMYNTPPTYSIYMCGLILEWIKNLGGVDAIEKINIEKAGILYNYLDESKLFKGCAEKEDRSIMNATFVTGNPELDDKFVKEAKANGFVNIKGHRSVGGMRASIYNAMPIEGVKKLVEFMKKFEIENK